jgi:adenylate kinase family enzyme
VERVVVLGPVAAGKSTLARAISVRTGLPVVYLDHLFWRPGWTPARRDEALRGLDEAITRDTWILDGNFLANGADGADRRFERADTVIFLDQSRLTCLWRVAKRIVRYRGQSRADLPEGCPESYDHSLLRWIWSYPKTDRPRVLELLVGLNERVDVHHLRSRAEVRRFLATLPGAPCSN